MAKTKKNKSKLVQKALWLGGLLLLAFIAYSNSFNASFQLDDYSSILGNRDVHRVARFLTDFWLQINERPFSLFTLFLNYRFVQSDPFAFHVTNFIIHGINTVLVFGVSQKVFQKLNNISQPFWYALFTAALFALHPLQTATVTYIVQRMTQLSALFYLLATWQFISLRVKQINGQKMAKLRWIWIAIFFVFGLLSKQNMVALPLTFVVLEFILFTPKANRKKLLFLSVGTLTAVLLGFAVILSGLLPIDADYTPLEYGLTQTRVVWDYFQLMVLPVNQVAFSAYPLSESFGLAEGTALLGHVALIGAALFYAYRFPLLSLGVLWMYAALAVESSILPIVDLYFEHRTYLALIGFGWILADLFHRFVPNLKMRLTVFAGLALLFSFLTFQRNKVWENHYTFWTDIIEKEPNNARAYVGLAAYYETKNNKKKSYEFLLKSYEIKPNYEAAYNLGSYFLQKNQLEMAKRWLRKAVELNAVYAPAYNNLGTIATKKGKPEEALKLYQKAINLNADYLEAKFNLGLTAMNMNQLELAEAAFYNYLDLEPNHIPTLFNSARVSLLLNKYDQAQLQLNKLFNIDPNNRAGKELQRYLNQNK